MSTVSIVLSRLQFARQGSFAGSTCHYVSVCAFGCAWEDRAYDTVSGRHTGKVDFGNELDGGWLFGILVAAVHLQGVNTVLMDALVYI